MTKRRYRFSFRRTTWHRPTYAIDRFAEGTVVRVWVGWLFFKVLIDDKVGEPQRRLTDRQAEWELMNSVSRDSLNLAREIGDKTRDIIGTDGPVRRVPFNVRPYLPGDEAT